MRSDAKLEMEGLFKTTMDEFFMSFVKDKFKLSKIIKKQCEQTIISVMKNSAEDFRIDLFRKFLGLGEDKIKREVLDCYLSILKNLPVSFYKLFEEKESTMLMGFDISLDILKTKFGNYFIHITNIEKLLRKCELYKNDKELDNQGLESKKDVFFLQRYYEKSIYSFEILLNDFKTNSKTQENYLMIAEQIMIANKDYDINLFQIVDIIKRNFTLYDNKIQLESFLNYFVNKFALKIQINDFIQITVEALILIYSDLDKIAQKMWDNADTKRDGYIFFKEFESVMLVFLKNSENKWKITEYFK